MKEFILPVVAVILNLALGARTGLSIFYVAASVILALTVLKAWRMRGANRPDGSER